MILTEDEAKVVTKYRRKTPLECINKAQSQIRMAHQLIKSQHMAIHYADAALAQLAVAYANLENYRVYHLQAAPKKPSAILALGKSLMANSGVPFTSTAPRLLPGAVETTINVSCGEPGQ